MVGNVTNLPPFIATPSARNSEHNGAATNARAERTGESAVRVDANIEYRRDVVASRAEMASAKGALDLFIAVARQARSVLLDARDIASRAAQPETPDAARAAQDIPFRALVQELSKLVDSVVESGSLLATGGTLSIDADPDGAQDLEITGLDLRVKAEAGDGDTVLLTRTASVATLDGALGAEKAADASIARIDAGLRKVEAGAARLEGHDRLLSALENALSAQVTTDLDADAARLIALQVRQELSRSASPIANASPSAVLALFRD